jgi:hypothetical protein
MNNQSHDFCRITFMDGLWSVWFYDRYQEPLSSAWHFACLPSAKEFALTRGFSNPEFLDYSL